MKKLKLVLNIPDNKWKEIKTNISGTENSITLNFIVEDNKDKKKKAISKRLSQIKGKNRNINYHKFTSSETQIFKKWNLSSYILYAQKNRELESRNYSLKINSLSSDIISLKILKRAIRIIGEEKIIEEMDIYFDCCFARKHIWDKTNHGFKNIIGFLKKLLSIMGQGESPWWNNKDKQKAINDKHPKITKSLADFFATYFLGRKIYDLQLNTEDYLHFLKFRQKIKKFKRPESTYGEVAQLVFEILDKKFDTVYPAHLSSSKTWNLLLPQFMKRNN